MSEAVDFSAVQRTIGLIFGLDGRQIREVHIHPDYVSVELIDGSVQAFLREDQA